MKVVAALSGGVDSSVMAGLLKEAGHEVIGITLKLAPDQAGAPSAAQRCCSVDDAMDARGVCAALGIPFYVIDAQQEFADRVITPFAQAYRAGLTPIPCLACNVDLKFGHLLDRAVAMGARLATGHYARLVQGPYGPELHRPVDVERDQTYFLYAIGRDALFHMELPLGEMTKPVVREHARRLGLGVQDKPDSQEICFVPDEGHAGFVERWDGQGPRPGRLMGLDGQEVGRHSGVHALTVGQRKGLGVAARSRLYVLQLDGATGDALVGAPEDLEAHGLLAANATWLCTPDEFAELSKGPLHAQIRARHRPAPVRLEAMPDGRFLLWFQEPQRAIAPGQSAVLFAGSRCLGGGVIEASVNPLRRVSQPRLPQPEISSTTP